MSRLRRGGRWIIAAARWTQPRYGALLAAVGAVAIAHELLNRHRFNQRDPNDARLLFAVGIVLGGCTLIMLAETRWWTLRKTGIFGIVLFDAAFYGLFLGAGAIWRIHLSAADQNWFRAVLIVAAPLLLISQLRHVIGGCRAWRARRREQRRSTAP